jgi:hypothetical protein
VWQSQSRGTASATLNTPKNYHLVDVSPGEFHIETHKFTIDGQGIQASICVSIYWSYTSGATAAQ